jgi:hypothetical protein
MKALVHRPDVGGLAALLRGTTLAQLLAAGQQEGAARGRLLAFPESANVLESLRALQKAGVRSAPVVAGDGGSSGAAAGGSAFSLSAFRGFVEVVAVADQLLHGGR